MAKNLPMWLAIVASWTIVSALAHGHHATHGETSSTASDLPDRGPRGSLYVSIRVDGECSATLAEVHDSTHFVDPFHPIPMPLPVDAPVDTVIPFDSTDFGTMGLTKTHRDMTWMAAYETVDPTTGTLGLMGHVFLDPRIRVGESRFGAPPPQDKLDDDVSLHHTHAEGEKIPIVHHLSEDADIHMIWIPPTAKHLQLFCRNTSAMTRHVLTHRRHQFHAEAASNINFTAVQTVGPIESQASIVFLASGFQDTKPARDAFDAIVDRIRDGMGKSTGDGFNDMHRSVPFDRYWPFYNVFKVFQPSGLGATRALQGYQTDNNLKCYHPTTLERALTCNIELTMALAAVTPAQVKDNPDRTVIIVIVNTNLYGGSAMYKRGSLHIGHFYRGYAGSLDDYNFDSGDYDQLKFNSLVKHEIGHAYGNLFDEYDIGITEPTDVKLLNCQSPQGVNNPSWAEWITIKNSPAWATRYAIPGQSDFTVQNAPQPICGYSNYYKPNTRCMMLAVRDYFMCPVCRAGATKTILNPVLSRSWPRFPREDADLLIPQSTSRTIMTTTNGAALYLPQALNDHYLVSWRIPQADGTFTWRNLTEGSVASMALTPTYLSTLTVGTKYTFTAYIEDRTHYLTDTDRASMSALLKSSTVFNIRVVADVSAYLPPAGNATLVDAVTDNGGSIAVGRLNDANDNYGFYEDCFSSKCRQKFTSNPYADPPGLGAFIADFDTWVLYMQGGLAVLFLLLWFWAYNYYRGKSSQVVRPIFRTEFSGIVNLIRRTMIFAAVMFMLSSLGALGVSAYYYTKTSALGKVIIIAGTVLSFGLYIMAFIGFWAVSYRSKKLVIVNGAVLYVGLTLLVITSALAISIGQDIKDKKSYWNRNLETFWTGLVKYNPERACAIQGMLECSGFYIACNTVVQSTEACPADCDRNNRQFGTACQLLISDYIANNYTAIIQVLGVCVLLMFGGLLFNFIYFVGLAKMKRDIRRANDKRVHRHASATNASMKQVDKCKALYILKTLDDGDMGHLMKEFSRIDTDGNGELDRNEFVQFFRKALCYKPSAAEIDEIYRVADLDGDGTISMQEFMCLFNKNAVAANSSPRAALRRTMDPTREAELRRRAAKVFGEDVAGSGETAEMATKGHPATTKAKPYRPTQTQIPDPEGLL